MFSSDEPDLATLPADKRPERNEQYSPFPHELADLVASLRYWPGWQFSLRVIERDHADTHQGAAGGLTFIGLTGTRRLQQGGGWSYNDRGDLVRDPDGDYAYEGQMDAYHPDTARPVLFFFPVPAATFNRASWQRWLFDRLGDVDRHERMEGFQLDETRPYAPTHAPGWDPYVVHEYAPEVVARTSFRGTVKDA